MESIRRKSSLPEKVRTVAICNVITLCFWVFLFLENAMNIDLESVLINPMIDPVILSIATILILLVYLGLYQSSYTQSKSAIILYSVLAITQLITYTGIIIYTLVLVSLPSSTLILSYQTILYLATCVLWSLYLVYSIFVVALFHHDIVKDQQLMMVEVIQNRCSIIPPKDISEPSSFLCSSKPINAYLSSTTSLSLGGSQNALLDKSSLI